MAATIRVLPQRKPKALPPAPSGPVITLDDVAAGKARQRCQDAVAVLRGHVLLLEARDQAAALDSYLRTTASAPGRRNLAQYREYTELVKSAARILRPEPWVPPIVAGVLQEMWTCPSCERTFDCHRPDHGPCAPVQGATTLGPLEEDQSRRCDAVFGPEAAPGPARLTPPHEAGPGAPDGGTHAERQDGEALDKAPVLRITSNPLELASGPLRKVGNWKRSDEDGGKS